MISNSRKKHIFGVSEFLKEYGKNMNFSDEQIKELYTLGLLHDIGYEFLEEIDYQKHNIVGGLFLQSQGYKFWQEIYYHGTINSPYKSEYLDLLNFADMHINSEGNYVSFEERLDELSKKYNVNIKNLDSYLIIQELKQKGYN